ncbi:UNVERIFIED_CONTAM: hypothetical protein K2H54_057442, partial [Gekko kuhli]
MASKEDDGFLSLQDPEPTGHSADEPKSGAAKRPAPEAFSDRSSDAASKRAKKTARAIKASGTSKAAMSESTRHKQKVGNGLQGKNPQKDCPDAASYSGAQEIGHGPLLPNSGDAEAAEAAD